MKKGTQAVTDIPAEEVRAACDTILASRMFIKASRMSRLLRFLVEQAICDGPRSANEFEVGIGVFDRIATVYNPNEDPIVRVQVGRLRTKLKKYYETLGADAAIEIEIPIGCYMPIIRRTNNMSSDIRQISQFKLYPFRCVSFLENGEELANGLHNEIMHRLFQTFGNIVVAKSLLAPEESSKPSSIEINHRIEGCIQVDAVCIRVSICLINGLTGRISWAEQFNHDCARTIALQEEIAVTICKAIQRFLYHS